MLGLTLGPLGTEVESSGRIALGAAARERTTIRKRQRHDPVGGRWALSALPEFGHGAQLTRQKFSGVGSQEVEFRALNVTTSAPSAFPRERTRSNAPMHGCENHVYSSSDTERMAPVVVQLFRRQRRRRPSQVERVVTARGWNGGTRPEHEPLPLHYARNPIRRRQSRTGVAESINVPSSMRPRHAPLVPKGE